MSIEYNKRMIWCYTTVLTFFYYFYPNSCKWREKKRGRWEKTKDKLILINLNRNEVRMKCIFKVFRICISRNQQRREYIKIQIILNQYAVVFLSLSLSIKTIFLANNSHEILWFSVTFNSTTSLHRLIEFRIPIFFFFFV